MKILFLYKTLWELKMLYVVLPGWNKIFHHHGKEEAQPLLVLSLKAVFIVNWSQGKTELWCGGEKEPWSKESFSKISFNPILAIPLIFFYLSSYPAWPQQCFFQVQDQNLGFFFFELILGLFLSNLGKKWFCCCLPGWSLAFWTYAEDISWKWGRCYHL